jgi:hypothetical protein
MAEHILVINPGSTSTKVAVFDGEKELFSHTAEHDKQETLAFSTATEEMELRRSTIQAVLKEHGMDTIKLDGVAGRHVECHPCHAFRSGICSIRRARMQSWCTASTRICKRTRSTSIYCRYRCNRRNGQPCPSQWSTGTSAP